VLDGSAVLTEMAIKKWLALASTVALTGCCASGSGCYGPTPGTPIAWDGLGSAPSENVGEYKPRRNSRRNNEIVIGPLNEAKAAPEPNSQPDDRWAQEQAAALEADRKLTRQLKICGSC
jgi:hypothetical protein